MLSRVQLTIVGLRRIYLYPKIGIDLDSVETLKRRVLGMARVPVRMLKTNGTGQDVIFSA